MRLHFSSKHVEQVEGKTDVFCVAMEVEYDFIASIFARQVETWDVFSVFVIYLLWVRLLFN